MFLSFVILPLELDVYKGDSYFCVYYLNVRVFGTQNFVVTCIIGTWQRIMWLLVSMYFTWPCITWLLVSMCHVATYHVTTCVYVSRDYLCLCVTWLLVSMCFTWPRITWLVSSSPFYQPQLHRHPSTNLSKRRFWVASYLTRKRAEPELFRSHMGQNRGHSKFWRSISAKQIIPPFHFPGGGGHPFPWGEGGGGRGGRGGASGLPNVHWVRGASSLPILLTLECTFASAKFCDPPLC